MPGHGLAIGPARDGAWWRVLRLASTIGITVTGIVYVVAMRGVLELQGLEVWTDTVFHYLVPALTVVGWVAFGPRLRTDVRTLLLALLWPVAWLPYTLVRVSWSAGTPTRSSTSPSWDTAPHWSTPSRSPCPCWPWVPRTLAPIGCSPVAGAERTELP